MKAFPATGNYTEEFNGMDLRDYFAAKALVPIVKRIKATEDRDFPKGSYEFAAKISYKFADAMIKAREVR